MMITIKLNNNIYIAFLRGINVGGHHKVPMAELREQMEKIGMRNCTTLLNSGNIIFESSEKEVEKLEKEIAIHLEKYFKFPIPVLIRKAEEILELSQNDPFQSIEATKDIRLYVSFLVEQPKKELKTPWATEDKSFQILEIRNRTIISVLDLSKTKTVKGMEVLEQHFGKNVTTRNWNTIQRVAQKLEK